MKLTYATALITLFLIISSCGTTKKAIYFRGDLSKTGIYEANENGVFFQVLNDSTTSYLLNAEPSIPASEFKLTKDDYCNVNDICVAFKLTPKSTLEYEKLTKRNFHKQIFYVVNGHIVSAPEVLGVIKSGNGQFPVNEDDFKLLFIQK
ncbi:MAG: hypothetical protein COA38_08085 [Fluviicola sp.]|nr:MAG: hypothetical protein COA38_08085 [Fluviicola sp.]